MHEQELDFSEVRHVARHVSRLQAKAVSGEALSTVRAHRVRLDVVRQEAQVALAVRGVCTQQHVMALRNRAHVESRTVVFEVGDGCYAGAALERGVASAGDGVRRREAAVRLQCCMLRAEHCAGGTHPAPDCSVIPVDEAVPLHDRQSTIHLVVDFGARQALVQRRLIVPAPVYKASAVLGH